MTLYRLICVFTILKVETASEEIPPGLLKIISNTFNNLSNAGLMPELMETQLCQQACEVYREAFYKNEMWAIEMYDSNAKLSSGILKGNINQQGNIKECINVRSKSVNGKFCYARIFIRPKGNKKLIEAIWNKIVWPNYIQQEPYSNDLITLSSVILFGLCLPSSCSPNEIMNAVTSILSPLNQSQYDFKVNVDFITEKNCAVEEEFKKFSYKFLFAWVLAFVFLATLVDAVFLKDKSENLFGVILIKSFSLKYNWKSVFEIDESDKNIKWMNGFNSCLLFIIYMIHFYVQIILTFINERNVWFEFILGNKAWLQVSRNLFHFIDLMIIFQGICHSYKLTKLLLNKKYGSIFKSFLYKYVRFLMFILIMMMGRDDSKEECFLRINVLTNNSSVWKVLLVVENMFGVQNMFFGPSYLLYINTQLYIGGIITLILIGRRKNSLKLFTLFIFLTIVYRSSIPYFLNKNPFIYITKRSLNDLLDTVNMVQNSALMRSCFYLTGLAIGYYIRTIKINFSDISSFFKNSGWIAACICFLCSFFCTFFEYYEDFSALKVSILLFVQTTTWIISWTWIVWFCHTFQHSKLNRFLSANIFGLFNRITGNFSFIHLIVLIEQVYCNRTSLTEIQLLDFGLNYLFVSVVISYLVVFAVQLPIENLSRYFIKNLGGKIKNE